MANPFREHVRHVNGDAARRLARIGEIIAKAKDSRAAPIQVLSWVRKALDAQVPISEQMTWNFCPECGHPVYQHNGEGCQHVDEALKACEDAECEQRGEHVHLVPEKCDCTWAHQLPVGV